MTPLWLRNATFVCEFVLFAFAAHADPDPAVSTSDRINDLRVKYKLPALAVLVVKDGVVCERAAVGVRKWGETNAVTTNDLFHIGSCTKSMTATLAAILVEEGKLNWTTRIVDVFPEFKGKINKQYEAVTLEQLLMHRSGLPKDPPPAAKERSWEEHGTPVEQRYEFIQPVLRQSPEAEPGAKMIYSNQGYDIAGAMLEKVAGKPFEDLIRERLFNPLHMQSAGFGPPFTGVRTNQPWGHKEGDEPVPTNGDNPPAQTPAGRVHCSLDDLSRFLMLHLEPDKAQLLKPETIRKLHTPLPDDAYAFGWITVKLPRSSGPALTHSGSNTMWWLDMWVLPDKKLIVIVATNIAGSNARKACNDTVGMMMQKWLKN
jgi:CubicO group peptidase (beta-lactamase class C family)